MWLATDKDGTRHFYSVKPKRLKVDPINGPWAPIWYSSKGTDIMLDRVSVKMLDPYLKRQTWDDEPIKVKVIKA